MTTTNYTLLNQAAD